MEWNKKIQKNLIAHGFINIAFESLDIQDEEIVCLKFISKKNDIKTSSTKDYTYKDLKILTSKFAKALRFHKIKKGEVVFTLLPRSIELYISAFGAMRGGQIFSPLFSAFGPDPILSRFQEAKGSVLVTTKRLYEKKIAPIRHLMTSLKILIILDEDMDTQKTEKSFYFDEFLLSQNEDYFIEKTGPLDPAILHFTSGTTGKPKGVLHAHQAVFYHEYSARVGLDLKKGDHFWCTADPGWVTGVSYGMIAPLCVGATSYIDEGEFQIGRWYEILSHFKINVWYTAPTALRMLMKGGDEFTKEIHLNDLRFAASVGEPLNPEVIRWVKENLSIDMHDNWWQTETGGIMIANPPHEQIHIGSMGKALPGIEIKLIDGEMAIKKNWPSMFRQYLHHPEKYKNSFDGDWYLTGDLARVDDEGYFWFIGRKDDLIKSSGHLVGPFEIESTLMEHPGVLEAAVIGVPDEIAGELIKAFVVLKMGFTPSEEIRESILKFARAKLGVAIAPREINFAHDLPKTRSGKMMRRLLKARELHLPEGDISTMETSL